MDKIRILVVDDEEDLCEILSFNLENEGYIVDVAHSAEEALKTDLTRYQLFLLDVMMGEMSGYKLGHHLKKNAATAHIPIIFITAKDTENDILTGFSIGADDYIAKPFSIRQVIARIQVALRRVRDKTAAVPNTLEFQSLVMDLDSKKLFIDNEERDLTKKEFEILELLLSHPNVIFTREDILNMVWKDDVIVLDRTIDVNINRLRKKISPYNTNLATRQGYGYCFETI